MTAKKGLGKTVLGWFVVDEDNDAAPEPSADQTAHELIAKYAEDAPSPPAPSPAERATAPAAPALTGDLPRAEGGVVDFPAVYRAAEITLEEQQRVEKAVALLWTLPGEAPREIKKRIVEASLAAFGIPVDQIIEAGAQQIQALEAYTQHGERDTQSLLGESTTRIEQLSAEIAAVRALMEQQVGEQRKLALTCNAEKLRVQQVLEFFGQEAIARVVEQSPKLIAPR